MDRVRFDELTRLLAAKGSRRAALGALLGAALLGAAPDALAKGKGKGKGRGKKRHDRSRSRDRGKERRQDKRKLAAQQEDCWPGVRCLPKKGGNVSKCDFEDSPAFEDLDCTRCNLSHTNLRNADASGANFTRANLSYACLVDANFMDAIIAGNTNLSHAIFCRTTMPGGDVNNSSCNNPTACCPTCNLGEGDSCGLPGDVCCVGACLSGACSCPSGQTNCSGNCTDTDTNDNHCGACGAACPAGSSCEDGQCVIVVTAADMQGWQFYNDQIDEEIGSSFDVGPGTPPHGSGSAELTVAGSSEGEILSARIYNSTPLADFAELKYTVYVSSATSDTAPSLQLGIDFDPGDAATGWQGRMVYVPSETAPFPQGSWITIDALADNGGGNWYFTCQATAGLCTGSSGGACPQGNKCNFSEILGLFPDIRIHPVGDDAANGPGIGFIGFKVGSGEGAVDANVDSLLIKLTGATEPTNVYDFEP